MYLNRSSPNVFSFIVFSLTLTLVVFECHCCLSFLSWWRGLTLTLVVFEYIYPKRPDMTEQKFNLNIGCIWISDVFSRPHLWKMFNLNIGCIWMHGAELFSWFLYQFNLNIGCIWIDMQPTNFYKSIKFNLNIGCIWIC